MEKPSSLNNGCEQHEFFTDARGRRLCQYDYRHTNGILYRCVKKTLKACVEARNAWLEDEASKAAVA